MYSQYQSAYFAHWLSLQGNYEESLTKTIASAKVDMNPHQIDAALFALQSPFSKGVLLADEVGLGKTIEGCLVIAQRWAEKRRKILLLVPASLRKQWEQELWDKFHLPSIIIDGKILKQQRTKGTTNPFQQTENIVICSYEFGARNHSYLEKISWDLVVFDEAHKLRNVYKEAKSEAKNAKKLKKALSGSFKLLLSATPLQNSMLELYGLISMIDSYFFGDLKSFKKRYSGRISEEAYQQLSERLSKIVYRTLRKDVQAIGDIQFTRRYSFTQDFSLMPEEQQLYEGISAYLNRTDTQGINQQARQLVSFTFRKILASSSFAISATLDKIVQRLEEQKDENIHDLLSDFETLDEYTDKEGIDLDDFNHINLKKEINMLRQYRDLAKNIKHNSKGQALLTALPKALKMNENMGGQDKVVIFTESLRTQKFIKILLEDNSYKNQLVLLNGNNNDPESKTIYKNWKEKYSDSKRLSGVKAADIKAAIIDHFKHQATILITTESGGEGINLQFCSILINYDLPWNPQRVEQRIGRIHRYGQKNDVVIVNFLNRDNYADERVLQLLNKKCKLFDGVFGASDDILGALSGDIDIEKRIDDIYQNHCRNQDEIKTYFNQLEQDFDKVLTERDNMAKNKLLQYFSKDVVKHLKSRRGEIDDRLNNYQNMLKRLIQAEINAVKFNHACFVWENKNYCLDWKNAKKQQAQIFNIKDSFGKDILDTVKSRRLPDQATLQFYYEQQELPKAVCFSTDYLNLTGYLQLDLLTIESEIRSVEYLLASAYTDADDIELPEKFVEDLLLIPSRTISDRKNFKVNRDTLAKLRDKSIEDRLIDVQKNNEKWFDQEVAKLDHWQEDEMLIIQSQIDELDDAIRLKKKQIRSLSGLRNKLDLKKEIKELERKRHQKRTELYEKEEELDKKTEIVLDNSVKSLDLKHHIKTLFTIRWELLA